MTLDGIPEVRSGFVLEEYLKIHKCFFSRRERSCGEMSKGHFRIISKVSFRKICVGQRIESETDSWYQEAWDWMFFIFSASKKLEDEEKESGCYMSWSATFYTKGKLRPASSLLEPRVQAWGGHMPVFPDSCWLSPWMLRESSVGPPGPCSRG